jgi:hypothetical protein
MTSRQQRLRLAAAACFAVAAVAAILHADSALRQGFIAGGLFFLAVSTI